MTNIDKQKVFGGFKKELSDYKAKISSFDKTKKNKFEEQFYNGLLGLKDNISNSNLFTLEEKAKFSQILNKLQNSNEDITKQDIDFLVNNLSRLEQNNAISLEQTDLQNMQESIEQIQRTKQDLNKLRGTITNTTQSTEVQQAKEKIEEYKEKLKGFSKEHPIWTKALIMLLPASLAGLFKAKKTTENNEDIPGPSSGWMGQIKDILSQVKSYFSFAMDWMTQIAVMFFSMPIFGAPKEMQELLADMKENLSKINPEIMRRLLGEMPEVVEGLKNITPEKLQEGKDKILHYMDDKATDWFGIVGSENKKKYKKVLEKWWKKISSDKNIGNFISDITSGKKSLEKMELNDIMTGLGIGVSGVLSFLSLMYDEGLISLKQIGLKLVKKGGEIVLQTALFFPKLVGVSLGEFKLEDLYNFVETNSLEKAQKDMLMVMIYRAINTPPFSILQHIAALPFYGVSAIANSNRAVTGGKIFMEAIKGNSIDNQISVLSLIEKKITGRKGKIYEKILEGLKDYKKGVSISFAYSQAKGDVTKFKKLIKDMGLKDVKVSDFIENSKLSDYKLTSYIDGLSSKIKNLDETYGKSLPEKIKAEIGGVFGDTNFFKEATKTWSENLKNVSEIYKKGLIFDFYRRWKGKINFAVGSTGNIKLSDLSHFTGEINDFKSFSEDLRQLAVHSPDIVKFFFRNGPVIILGNDIINSFKNGKGSIGEIAKIYMEFVPIVGPITFLATKEGKIDYTDIGTTAVWLGLDSYFVYKMKTKNIFKLAASPIIDTAKFIGNSIDVLGRYKVNGNIIEKLIKIKSKNKWIAVAVGILTVMYGAYKYVTDDKKNNNLVNTLSVIARTNAGLEGVNEYILKNWNTFKEEEKKQILVAFLARYMGFTPDMLENYINGLEINGKEIKLLLTEKGKNADIVKIKLLENGGSIGTMLSRLGYNEKLLLG